MVTSADKGAEGRAGNIYEFNAEGVLALYGAFVDGDVDDLLVVISTDALAASARGALEASAERLGFGSRIAWVVLRCADGELGPGDLERLVEGLDPVAVIVADGFAASEFSKAYSTSLDIDGANRVSCRTVIAFANFESMLESDDSKQKAWRLLKKLRSNS